MHRGQPEVSLDVEASLRSRSPGGQLGRQLEVTRRSAGPLSQQRVRSAKVVKGCFALGALYNKVPVWLVLSAPVAFYTS